MVLVATQVKRRRGTTAENDAFTGAEGEITVDTEKHELRVHDGETQGGFVIGAGGSGSGHNIGDIFYTTRTDTGLAGAVECNGGTYSTADYEGEGSIGELLAGGKLPYVSLAEYAQRITNMRNCAVFGWDGGTTFRVPTLRDIFIEATNSSSGEVNWYKTAGLPNITGYAEIWGAGIRSGATGALVSQSGGTNTQTSQGGASGNNLRFDASNSSAIYGNSTTVQPEAIKYRAMVQLFNSTTDEAVATVGTVVAQVSENTTQIANRVIKGHEVIAFQAPTAENGYTWYRKYADGWVEQGGICPSLGYTVTFPVTMADTNYTALGTARNTSSNYAIRIQDITVTGMKLNSSATNTHAIWWTVSGISA